jgi:hypothetical protein
MANDGRYRQSAGISLSATRESRAAEGEADWSGDPGPWLREELLRRRNADQEARSAVARGEPDALALTMRIDDENAAWLRNVVSEWGWPARSIVGDEAAHAAWLLTQHADRDPSLQKRCLTLLEAAVAAGEASSRDLAFLTDRVLLAGGGTQIYGTQVTARDGRFAACRLRDPETVDDRRASVGLESLESYLSRALDLYGTPSPAPVICPNCRAEMEAWLPELGGRSTVECASCHSIHELRPSIPKTPEM